MLGVRRTAVSGIRMKPKHWVSILGNFSREGDELIFKGGTVQLQERQSGVEVGNFVSNLTYGGGVIRSRVTFRDLAETSAAGLILYYQPTNGAFVAAQLGGPELCSVRTWSSQDWTVHAAHGQRRQLESQRPYDFQVLASGSRVLITLDTIRVIDTNLPFSLPRGQAGIWAMGSHDIAFSDFEIEAERPKLFVVMQFSDPFNELYRDVIKPVGDDLGFDVVRADDTYGPGIIIADIERHIVEARAIVADITPTNANVFWEVGYAHALRKPTILIAERNTKLPFDVSPFRTLFYENTIAGKSRVEEGLRKHITAIQGEWPNA